MPSVNHQKVAQTLKRAVATIITEDVYNLFFVPPSVTTVFLSADRKQLVVHLAFPSTKTHQIKKLQKKRGLIRTMLAQRTNVRRVPEVRFVLDPTVNQNTILFAKPPLKTPQSKE